MASRPPLFSAVSSSARQILLLLRCISFSKTATVRITTEGLRFSTEEGSVMEAFIHLEKNLFTSYKYNIPDAPPSSQDNPPEHPIFEVNLVALLETLNIFSVSDQSTAKRSDEYSAFAAHRLNRHANQNAFNNPLHVAGICTFTYDGEGSPLSVHMSEAGVTTTCDLTTYEAEVSEEIPFQREHLALKTIMRSTFLLDALSELNNMGPQHLTIQANPDSRTANISLSASGAYNPSLSLLFHWLTMTCRTPRILHRRLRHRYIIRDSDSRDFPMSRENLCKFQVQLHQSGPASNASGFESLCAIGRRMCAQLAISC